MMRALIQRSLLLTLVFLMLLTGCGGSSDTAADTSATMPPDTQQVQTTNGPPAIPAPTGILGGAKETLTEDVEYTSGDDTYILDCYSYTFTGSQNVMDTSKAMAYGMLLQGQNMKLEQLTSELTYREYGIVWDEHLLGFLVAKNGRWDLYVPEDIGVSASSYSAFQNESYGVGTGSSGSFRNESFGITVRPGEGTGNGGYVSSTMCESCKGSGDCIGCNGDGRSDNIFFGQKNTSRCDICDGDGVCTVCDGEGVWQFD